MMTLQQKIDDALSNNKIGAVRKLATILFKEQDKLAWDKAKRGEYKLAYPSSKTIPCDVDHSELEAITDCPKCKGTDSIVVEINYISTETITDEDGNETEVEVRVPESFITFSEWMAETKVISEVVQEVSHIEDEVKVIDVPYAPRVTALVRQYEAPDVTERVTEYIRKRTVPTTVTMRQARLALLNANMLATVSTAIESSDDEALKIEWEYATEIERGWVSFQALMTALGLSETQVDDLFIAASKL